VKFIISNQKGQGLIEYLIIVALVGVAAIAVMRIIGQNVNTQFARVSNAIQGGSKTYQMEQVDDSHVRTRDLSDFFHGATRRDRDGH